MEDLRNKLDVYMKKNRLTVTEMAEEMDVPRPYLSEFINGKSRSEKTEASVTAAIVAFFDNEEPEEEPIYMPMNKKAEAVMTGDFNGILYVCKTCQDKGGLGVVTGKPGGGKTYSLRHYAKLPKTVYIECNDTMNTRDLVKTIRKALGLTERSGSINDAIEEVCEFCNDNPGYILMIDEADKMLTRYTQKKMEIIRSLYDNAELAIVLAGEPSLENDIKRYVARMADRMDWTYRLHGLTKEEVVEYVSGRINADEDAISELTVRATNGKNGSFRRLNRMVENLRSVYKDEIITRDKVCEVARMMF